MKQGPLLIYISHHNTNSFFSHKDTLLAKAPPTNTFLEAQASSLYYRLAAFGKKDIICFGKYLTYLYLCIVQTDNRSHEVITA